MNKSFVFNSLFFLFLVLSCTCAITAVKAKSKLSDSACEDCPKSMTECINNKCSYARELSVIIESTVENTYCSASDFPNKSANPSSCFGTGANAIGPFIGSKTVSLPTGCLLLNKPEVTVMCNQGFDGNPTCLNKLEPPLSGKVYAYPKDFVDCTF